MDVLRERLAAYAHDEAWSHWMAYLFSKCKPLITLHDDSGALVIPGELVERWKRQASTRFASLPGAERESDRAQADKILAIVEGQVARMVTDAAGAEIAALEADNAALRAQLARIALEDDPTDEERADRASAAWRAIIDHGIGYAVAKLTDVLDNGKDPNPLVSFGNPPLETLATRLDALRKQLAESWQPVSPDPVPDYVDVTLCRRATLTT